MKWILLAVIVLLMIVVIIVAVGAALPREHVARTRATFNATADSVWTALTDVAAYPTWRTDLRRVEILPEKDGHPMWREHDKHDAITYERIDANAPSLLQVQIADETLPFGGTWTYSMTDAAGKTVVAITEDGVVRNPLFRFMSRYVFGHYGTQEKLLRALGRKFNEDVTPERLP